MRAERETSFVQTSVTSETKKISDSVVAPYIQLIGKCTLPYIKPIHVHIRAAQSPLPVASKLADGLRSIEMTVRPVSLGRTS